MDVKSILRVCSLYKTGTLLRFCSQKTLDNIEKYSKQFNNLRIEIVKTNDFGTCVKIFPSSYRGKDTILEDSKKFPKGSIGIIKYQKKNPR